MTTIEEKYFYSQDMLGAGVGGEQVNVGHNLF